MILDLQKCKNGMWERFIALAGLFSHLEGESCAYMRFEKVQQQVSDVIQGRRLITSI
jgi:hypothetical protein